MVVLAGSHIRATDRVQNLLQQVKSKDGEEMRLVVGELIGYLYNLPSDSGRALSEYLLAEAKKSNLALLEISVLVHSYRFYDFNVQINNLRAAAALAKSEELFTDLAAAYQFMAVVFRDNAQADSALLYALAAKDLLEEYKPDDDLHHVLQLIADIHFYAGEYNLAEEIYKKILSELPANDKHWRYATLNNNLGLIYTARGEYKQAIKYHLRADNFLHSGSVSLGDSIGMIYVYRKLMELYLLTGDVQKARDYCEKGLSVMQKTGELDEMAGLYAGKARLMLQEAPEQAYSWLVKAESAERIKPNVMLKLSIYRTFTDYYSIKQDYQKKNLYLQKLLQTQKTADSLFSRTKLLHIYAQHQYKTSKEKLRTAERENVFLLAILLVIVITLAILLFSLFRLKRAYKFLVKKSLELVYSESDRPLGISAKADDSSTRDILPEQNTAVGRKSDSEETGLQNWNEQEAAILELVAEALVKLLHEEKIYLNKNLDTHTLAENLQTNRTYLYKATNMKFNMTPADLINGYRVKETIMLISNGRHLTVGVDGLAEESGFNNRVTFNRVFKKHTGLSPSVFMQNIDDEQKHS